MYISGISIFAVLMTVCDSQQTWNEFMVIINAEIK